MPAIQDTAVRTKYKFVGHEITIPAHYTPGHVMTDADARFANRQLASVTGNSLAYTMKVKAKALTEENEKATGKDQRKGDDGKPYVFTPSDFTAEAVQAEADRIFTEYEIGAVRATGTGSGPRDPVEALANNIAWERIKEVLAKKNIKSGTIKAEHRAKLIADLRDRDPSILEQAKSALGREEADTAVEGLDLSILEASEGEAAQSGDTAEGQGSVEGGSDLTPSEGRVETSEGNEAETAPTGGAFA